MNGKLKQVVDAWPLLVAFTSIMGVLLYAYASIFVSQIVTSNIATTPKIIAMDMAIQRNEQSAESAEAGVQRIENKIDSLEGKIDNLVTIMLTED